MKTETIANRIKRYRAELQSLRGGCDRSTSQGRTKYNRKSTIYRNIKRCKLAYFKQPIEGMADSEHVSLG